MATIDISASGTQTSVVGSWTNPGNVVSENGQYATASPGKNSSITADFAFPNVSTAQVPSGSTINSITFWALGFLSASVTGGLLGVQAYRSGSPAAGSSEGTHVGVGVGAIGYASSTGTDYTEADIRSASTVIKARVRAAKGNTNTSVTVNFDHLFMRIDYTPPASGTTHVLTGEAVGVAVGSSYAPTVKALGPVSYWRLGGAGSAQVDEQGVQNGTGSGAGISYSEPGLISADADTAVLMAGSDVVSVPDNAAYDLTTDVSIVAWVKFGFTPTAGVFRGIVSKAGTVPTYQLQQNGLKTEIRIDVSGSNYRTQSPDGSAVLDGVYCIVATRSGATARLWMNGVLVAERTDLPTGSMANSSDAIRIGGLSGEGWQGVIDEVAIFGRALTRAEVLLLLAAGLTPGRADLTVQVATTTHVLTGSASGAGSASGSVTARVALSGSAAGAGTASAQPTARLSLSGSAAGAGSASLASGQSQAVTGSATGTGSASGSITSRRAIAGSATGAGSASLALTSRMALSGSAAGSGAATGTGAVRAALSGSAAGSGALSSATATIRAALTGSAIGSGAASGTVDPAAGPTTHALSGSATGTGTAAGTTVSTPALTGSATGTGTATASSTIRVSLAGSSSGSGTATGSATVRAALTGSAAGTGSLAGSVAGTQPLTGTATGSGSTTGALTVRRELQGTATAAGTVSGTITLRAGLSGAAAGSGAAQGFGTIRVRLTGSAIGIGSAEADLSVTPPFIPWAPGRLHARVTQTGLSATVAVQRVPVVKAGLTGRVGRRIG